MPADAASSSTDVASSSTDAYAPEFFDPLRSAADDAADLALALRLQAEEDSKAFARDATLASAIGQAADEARAAHVLPQPTRFERLVGARVRIPYFGTADMCEAIAGTDNERREAMIAIRAAALADDRGSAVRLAKPPPTAFERAIGARMRGSLGTQDEVDVADGCASDEAIAAAEERERLRRQAMGTELKDLAVAEDLHPPKRPPSPTPSHTRTSSTGSSSTAAMSRGASEISWS